MLASLLLTAALAVQAPDTAHVIIVATTDLHGHVVGWDYVRDQPVSDGLARVATVVDSLRRRFPEQVVLVDAGDVIEGDPFATYFSSVAPRDPHPVIDAMNAIGYDAATPGDHEFNLGLATMDRALSAAHFPYVSGNLLVPPRDTFALPPYTVLTRQGVRIGITGFTTTGVTLWDGGKLEGRLRVARIESSAARVLREMRQDADLLVVLAHTGMEGASSYDTTGVGPEHSAATLGTGPVRPDIVVVGHSHREMTDSLLNGVHFVQPPAFGQGVVIVHVTLTRRSEGWRPTRIRAALLPLAKVQPDARFLRRVDEAHSAVRGWMAQGIGEMDGRMKATAARVEDTPVIRFITDAERRRAHADLASTPVFDLRAGFDQGQVTIGEVVGLYPPDHTLKAIRISGGQLRAYLEQSARYFYSDSTGRVAVNALVSPLNYDIVGGARYTIDLTGRPGDRIRDLSVNGKPVEPADSFTLALSSFRQAGGGNFAMLRGAPVVYDRGQKIRDLLVAEVKARAPRSLSPEQYPDTLWHIAPPEAARAARALFVRDLPPPPPPDTVHIVFRPPPSDSIRRDSVEREIRRVDSTANAVVTTLRLPLTRDAGGLGLGAVVADAYRNALRADAAIVQRDEVEADLPAGEVSNRMVNAVLTTARPLLRLTMSGSDLQWVMEHLVETGEPCCYLSGLKVAYHPQGPDYQRIKDIRLADGRKLNRRAVYTLAISERLVSGREFILGASECGASTGCARSGMLERWQVEQGGVSGIEAFFAYLRRLPRPVAPPEDQRLIPKR